MLAYQIRKRLALHIWGAVSPSPAPRSGRAADVPEASDAPRELASTRLCVVAELSDRLVRTPLS